MSHPLEADRPSDPGTLRTVRRWLLLLNGAVLAIGLLLGLGGSTRAFWLAALVPIALAPFSYARWRLTRMLLGTFADPRARVALATGGIILDVILVAQLLAGRSAEPIPWLQGQGVSWVGPVWFSAHGLLALWYGAAGLGRTVHRLVERGWQAARWLARKSPAATGSVTAPAAPAGPLVATAPAVPAGPLLAPASLPGLPAPDRREFLQLLGAGVPFVASLSGVPLSYDFRVEEREITLPGWPRALDGLRVVHLSDIHVGGGMTRGRLRRMAMLTNRCRPDLVAHTGDFLTHRSGEFDTPLYEALATIRAPHGQWACLGNHDYERPDRLTRKLGDAGVTVLRDRTAPLVVAGEPLELAGADFVFGAPRAAVYARLAAGWGARDGVPRLLLNHDPTAFWALPDGCADLVLSGHTHGGHVGVQLGRDRAVTVVGLLGLPDQGVFTRDDMRLFVTRCVGFYGYPMRIGIPPEIAVLVLRAPTATAPA